jgi:hypothetical protein
MSSSAGAAIGVPKGIAIILRQAEKMPSTGDMLVLFAIGIACFGIPVAGRLCRHPPDSGPPEPRRSAQPNACIGCRQDFTGRIVMKPILKEAVNRTIRAGIVKVSAIRRYPARGRFYIPSGQAEYDRQTRAARG